jgi:transposase
LRKTILEKGSENIIYIDESGFDNRVNSVYGWTKRGQKIYGEITGKRAARQNLMAARRRNQMLAPMIIEGSINAQCFEQWLSSWLLPALEQDSTLIMDNAPFHRKNVIQSLVTAAGHTVLFLPKYSPDFNKIEHDFAALKKRRANANKDTSLDSLVSLYASRTL